MVFFLIIFKYFGFFYKKFRRQIFLKIFGRFININLIGGFYNLIIFSFEGRIYVEIFLY